MNTTTLPEDIKIGMLRASSFPAGVMEAHQKLHSIVPFSRERAYYGISYPGRDGQIMYWAAAGELQPGDLDDKGLEPFTIRKGEYLYIDVSNYMQDTSAIGNAFQTILKDSRIAHDGYCVEQYYSEKECRCMVPMQ